MTELIAFQQEVQQRIHDIVVTHHAEMFLAQLSTFNARYDLPTEYEQMEAKHLVLLERFLDEFEQQVSQSRDGSQDPFAQGGAVNWPAG